MAKAKAVTVAKTKKKIWLPIVAPQSYKGAMLGETYVAEPASTIGRIIHVNLKEVTHNLKDQNAYVRFRISGFTGNTLNTEVNGYYLTPPSIKKLSKRNTIRMDDSFVVVTSDGKKLRVKPVSVSLSLIPRSLGSKLRTAIRNFVANEASKSTFADFIDKLIGHQLQLNTKKYASKVYPLKILEIKTVEIVTAGKAVEAKEIPLAPAEKKEKREKKAKQEQKTLSEEMQEELETPQEEAEEKKEQLHEEEQAQEEDKEQAEEESKPSPEDSADFGEEEQQ